jgi:hypothetical protein
MGYIHALDEPLPVVEREEKPKPDIDWRERARRMASHHDAQKARVELSRKLGVTTYALEDLHCGLGWDGNGRWFYSFPSRDAHGRWVGIQRRYEDGAKKTMYGGSLALFYKQGWSLAPGPVFIPEGPTDTAIIYDACLSAIGRPSRLGRSEDIAAMIAQWAKERPVVVLGENDRKPDSPCACGKCARCWPGLDGALETVRQLKRRLKNKVTYLLPPEGRKDVRDWILKDGPEAFLERARS